VTLVGVATVAAGVELLVPRKFPREGQNEVLRADAKTAEKFAKA
jgi:hypothetical protein